MRDRLGKITILLGAASAFAYLLLRPTEAGSAVTSGLETCARILIPSFFPYLVLSELMIVSGAANAAARRFGGWTSRLFRLPASVSVALVLGLLGGYPVGASVIGSLYSQKLLSKDEAERALPLCNNAGPSLFFGVIGGALFVSPAIGVVLYCVHIAAGILAGVLTRSKNEKVNYPYAVTAVSQTPFSSALTSAVKHAASALFGVCAFVVFFSVIAAACGELLSELPTPALLLRCALELTGGTIAAAQSQLPWMLKFPLIAAVAAWGGLSVHMQSASVLEKCQLSYRRYFSGKALHAALSAVIALPVSFCFDAAGSVATIPVRFVPISPTPWVVLSIAVVFLIFLQIPTGKTQ